MAENTVEALLKELEEAQKKLAEYEQPIKKKQSLWNFSKSPMLKSYLANNIKFCVTTKDNVSVIEFPKVSAPPMLEEAYLVRQLSVNSAFERIVNLNDEVSSIQDSLETQAQIIRERAEEEIQKIKTEAQPNIDSRNELLQKLVSELYSEIEGCAIYYNEKLHLLDSIDPENKLLRLTQLGDFNEVPLKEPKPIDLGFKDMKNIRAIGKEDLDKALQKLQDRKMVIQYQLIEIEDNQHICFPVHIKPEELPIQLYEIRFNNSQNEITEVINKEDGAVQFTTIRISGDCGLIQESTVEVFTAETIPNVINVLHVHLEDMKDEVAFDSIYMLPDQPIEEYFDWTIDANSIELRYKIMIKNGAVEAVLYNTGQTTEQLHFLERRVKVGELVRCGNNEVGEIDLLPTGMLVRGWQAKDTEIPVQYNRQNPNLFCHKRHLEELPGLVDVKVILRNGESVSGEVVCMPICECFELTTNEKAEVEACFEASRSAQLMELESTIEMLSTRIDDFKNSVGDDNVLLADISRLSQVVRSEIEGKPELQQKYADLLQQTNRALRVLSTRCRFG